MRLRQVDGLVSNENKKGAEKPLFYSKEIGRITLLAILLTFCSMRDIIQVSSQWRK